ncbi:MAG: RNA 2'-phosphotransferase [Erysipelotrichaceae bacterium]|nr:RNA 2'-phosphotransferase [Erysipelotrichaceae bacterium]
MNKTSISKYMSKILRHHPEVIGITLDEHGWANVQDLIQGISRRTPFDMEMLEEIVKTDQKQRYSFNSDKTLIRANQGHSIPVDVELEEAVPPDVLWHGSAVKYSNSISRQGLLPKNRLYVHLSLNPETAYITGKRHGSPVIYLVDAKKMRKDGCVFYRSVNGVWLTKRVPPEYLQLTYSE